MHDTRRACRRAAAAAMITAVVVAPLLATGEIRLAIDGGRVTLSATEAPLAAVLAEWSRLGGTRFVGAETLGGETVTLHLVDADEAEAIRLLLRSAVGYVAAPRRKEAPGAARYDRVTILATRTTRAPAVTNAAASRPRAADGGAPVAAGAAPTGLLQMEDLQRLLDAAATANSASTPPESATAQDVPVRMTPFPGIDTTTRSLRALRAAEGR